MFPRLVWFEAKRFQAYPLEAFANIIERSIQTGLFILLWLTIGRFSNTQLLSAHEVFGYFLIIGGFPPFFYAKMGIAQTLLKLIKNGELSHILLRPVNVIVYPWAMRTGRNFINMCFGLTQIIIGLLIAQPDLAPVQWLLFFPIFINALVINGAFNIMLGTLAFYFIEIKGFISSFGHVATLLRGELIPLFLMPATVQTVLQLTPFPASMYHLVGLLQGQHIPSYGQIVVGSIWAIVLLILAIHFWKRGLKKYEATGL